MKSKKLAALISAAAIAVTGTGLTAATAESISFTYAVSDATCAAAGTVIETGYEGITLALGQDTYTYTAAPKTLGGYAYAGRIAGVTNPNVSSGTGTCYSIRLDENIPAGELSVAYQVGANKYFYIEDNGVIMDAYNGIYFAEKADGCAEFLVEGGHTYTLYVPASKLSLYGFTYRVVDEPAEFEEEIQGLTFDLIAGGNLSAGAIDSNLDLPQSYESKFGSCDVSWSSSNTGIIANNGEVSLTTQQETITLTGKFSVQEKSNLVQEKTFILTTIADYDDNAAVEAAADDLSLGDLSGVKRDLVLPTAGKRATTITWSTSDESVITADGVITRTPNEDTHAVLSAVISRNGASTTRDFAITVKGYVPVEFINYVYADADGANSFKPVDGGFLKSISFTESIQNPTGEEIFLCEIYSGGTVTASKEINIKENSLGEDVLSTAEILLPMDSADTFVITALSGTVKLAVFTPDDTASDGAAIYVVGDSTASVYNDKNYPRKGWAQLLENYFDNNTVIDYALSGRSSLSFKNDTNYTSLQENIRKGDYLIIQFGHNDEKTDESTYTNPSEDRFTDGSYKKSLTDYIEIAQNVGAHPIIATSISRRRLSDAGLEAYVNAARELADELNLPLIDLYARANTWINEVGLENAKDMFNYVKPHDSRFIGYAGFVNSGFYETGTTDDTHININGADLISQWAVEEMQAQNLPLADKANSYRAQYPLPSYADAYDTTGESPTASPSAEPATTPSPAPTTAPEKSTVYTWDFTDPSFFSSSINAGSNIISDQGEETIIMSNPGAKFAVAALTGTDGNSIQVVKTEATVANAMQLVIPKGDSAVLSIDLTAGSANQAIALTDADGNAVLPASDYTKNVLKTYTCTLNCGETYYLDTVAYKAYIGKVVLTVSSADEPSGITVTGFESSNGTVTAAVLNNTPEPVTVGLFIPIYDTDGTLISVSLKTAVLNAGDNARLTADCDENAASAFLWNMAECSPLTGALPLK